MLILFLISCLVEDSIYTQRRRELEDAVDEDGDGHSVLTDCNDGEAQIYPDAEEICDGIDNDCDEEIDEEAIDRELYYDDKDGDGYGSAGPEDPILSCEPPPGSSPSNDDCDDSLADTYPGAEETWYDGIDSDCAGGDDNDADLDGYASDAHSGEDCDDSDPAIYPGANESWSDASIDNDCDGELDESVTLNLDDQTFLLGLEEGDRLGAHQLLLETHWSGTEPMLLVAAPGATDDQGEVYALRASEITSMASIADAEWILSGAWDDQALGSSMARIGSPSQPLFLAAAPGTIDSRLLIFHGPLIDTNPNYPDIEMEGDNVPGLGRATASDHDHDGDGLADLVVTRGHSDGSPDSLLIFLEPDRLPSSLAVEDADIELILDATTARLSLLALGDTNSDGLGDLGIGIRTDSSAVPGGLVLSWAREAGSYDLEDESSLIFYGTSARFGRPSDVDGDGNLELLAGPNQLYRFDLPLSTGTIDWSDADAIATLTDSTAELNGIHTQAPEFDGRPQVGVVSSNAEDGAGQAFLIRPDWNGEMELGSANPWLQGQALGDALGTSLVFFEAFDDSGIGLALGAPGVDTAGEDSGALYLVPPLQ